MPRSVPVAPTAPPTHWPPADTAPSEQRQVRLGDDEVSFLLKRSARRRRVGMVVDDRGLVLHAPVRCSEHHIETFLLESASWIRKKLAQWQRDRPRARSFESGDIVDYLGQQLRLDVIDSGDRPVVMLRDDHRLEVQVGARGGSQEVRLALAKWFKRHAEAHLRARVTHYAQALRLRKQPKTLISNATTRWGSCNSAREIRLCWRLMQARFAVIDYVVAHEVSHAIEMNHSPRFWAIVERLCPDYPTLRAELDAMTRHYMSL